MVQKAFSGVIAVDDGGSSTCVVSKDRIENFPSVKGLHGNRNLTAAKGKYDFIVEYNNEKYVMGTLAKYDCAMPIQMHTHSKQHLFYDLSVLVSLHQFGYATNHLIVSSPIEMLTQDEKNGRMKRLKGTHTISVNGVSKTFIVSEVKVAPETASAYWINEPSSKTRYIDIGSRTVNYASTIHEDDEIRFIDSESGTYFGKGLEALNKNYNAVGLADYICGKLSAIWESTDTVNLLGGGARDPLLVEEIKKYFPKATSMESPELVNAKGMYLLGRAAYGMA